VSPSLQSLVQAAGAAVNQGRWQEAERLWTQVRSLDPKHPQALYSLGVHAYRRGDLTGALQILQEAHAVAPRDPVVLLSTAVVLREMGDGSGELRAIDAALGIEPYLLAALLAKAANIERHVGARAAAPIWRNALKVAPSEERWPAALREQLMHARTQVRHHGERLAAFLEDHLQPGLDRLSPFEAERWREAGAIVSGTTQPYPSLANRLQVPRLPAIPFFDRSMFPWAEALEAKTEAITAEMRAVYSGAPDQFKPYVAYAPGTPVNQWQELNHSQRWSSYFLWRNGEAQAERLQQCPQTAQALAEVEMADIGGLCPNAMFSALAPRTAIPPHHGETNARLVVHLPLVVPEGCSYRVGYEKRRWRIGEVLVFDDSIEHEARNDSDELRVVLIFDIWNPLLSTGERDMVRTLNAATHAFHSQE
jgi:aspartyl/asparaginyl beta-hydroxylase (cupin superfamily)